MNRIWEIYILWKDYIVNIKLILYIWIILILLEMLNSKLIRIKILSELIMFLNAILFLLLLALAIFMKLFYELNIKYIFFSFF